MKIGEIIEVNGIKRVVTSFTTVEGLQCPNTKPYENEKVTEEIDSNGKATEKIAEEEYKSEYSVEVKRPEKKKYNYTPKPITKDFNCQFCNKAFASLTAVKAHERLCVHNPSSRFYKIDENKTITETNKE